MDLENNLFHYATKELSQDAFLCWLFSHAIKESNKDEKLKDCAVDFLKLFVPALSNKKDIFLSFEPQKQVDNIDILLTVNNDYKIIIEDKTYTREHSNQLAKYREIVEKKYPDDTVIGVFYKIGFQSDREEIKNNKYLYVGLDDICRILKKHSDIKNNIFKDYYDYVTSIEKERLYFKTRVVKEWNIEQIYSFFDYFKNQKYNNLNCNYGYVPNKAGGFYGMWISRNAFVKIGKKIIELYLMCQCSKNEGKENVMQIYYKAALQSEKELENKKEIIPIIETSCKSENDKKIDSETRKILLELTGSNLIEKNNKYNLSKPKRFSTGKTVTLGVFDENKTISNYEEAERSIKSSIDIFDKIIENIKNKKTIRRV